jgi:uncharacterized MAPEG superfamily protein
MANAFAASYKFLAPHFKSLPQLYSAEESIAAMLAIVYLSKFVQAGLSFLLIKKYDNVQATYRHGTREDRSWQAKTVERAYNAHLNHWEAFTAFSIAMILAIVKASNARAELTLLGNAFLYVRVLYNAVYVLAVNEPLSFVRSSVFFVGFVIIVRIFTIAVTA